MVTNSDQQRNLVRQERRLAQVRRPLRTRARLCDMAMFIVMKHMSSLQRRIVQGAVEQSGEASSGLSPVCPVVVSLRGRDSDFDQRSGMDILPPQYSIKFFGALSHASRFRRQC